MSSVTANAMPVAEVSVAILITTTIRSPRTCCALKPINRIAARAIPVDPSSEVTHKSASYPGALDVHPTYFRECTPVSLERKIGSKVRCVRVASMPPRLGLVVSVLVMMLARWHIVQFHRVVITI